jgi:hypothetical protein
MLAGGVFRQLLETFARILGVRHTNVVRFALLLVLLLALALESSVTNSRQGRADRPPAQESALLKVRLVEEGKTGDLRPER